MTITGSDTAKLAREAWLRALERTASIERNPALSLPILIEDLAQRHPARVALASPDSLCTYAALAARCRRYARFGLAQGLRPGDVVALMMHNCPDYMAVWLGLTRIGATVALINTHLTGTVLAHSIREAGPRFIVAGAALAGAVTDALALLPAGLSCWVSDSGGMPAPSRATPITQAALQPLDPELHRCGDAAVTELDCPLPGLDANALYIYTSGTTGLPKAARVSHRRAMQWSLWFAGLMDTGPGDRMYNCLPLYHSVGGIIATGATLAGGGTVVIRSRFSASDFWRDVHAERCTLFQYIGELCRYLVNAPPHPAETRHSLRLACGNGLRPEIWRTFESRFRIGRILEYYAATEGTFSLYNCEGEPGAIGRIPPYLRHRLAVELLRFDVETGDPWRDPDGFCRRCSADEVGEAVGLGRFEGYTDPDSSSRKLLRNVFIAGDTWYRTGDLMRRDARGFYYFVDRVGDTYRWKGENVSTAEVLSVLASHPGVLDGVVYGVAVPGADGRAGMAALLVDATFDLSEFHRAVASRLPAYARPVFLRLLSRLDSTGTFKPVKQELLRQGFDPGRVPDPLYVDSLAGGGFVRVDQTLYASITAGRVRL